MVKDGRIYLINIIIFKTVTRINIDYQVKKLNTKMLLAEHREIKRIPNMIRSGKARLENIPNNFTLGKGHVKFFYNKLGYLLQRYNQIYAECIKRGFNVQNYSESWNGIDSSLLGNFNPTQEDKQLIVDRINSKLGRILKS